jgi:hypothetical protein
MKKYYIELATDSGDIILQSKWYETEQEALKWAEDIHYIGWASAVLCLMSSVWDTEEDTYTDIIQEKVIKGGY